MSPTHVASPAEARPTPLPDWARVCETELDYVYWTLRRCGASPSDAEDLVQEVFLAMWRRRDTFQPERPLRPWIAGIAFRVLLEHRRRHRREVPGGLVDPLDETPSAEERLRAGETRALVLAALARLPDKQRIVLVMHALDGMPMREVAQTLGVPLFTLYSRLKHARAGFAKEIRRWQQLSTKPPLAAQTLLAREAPLAPVPPDARRRTLARLRALVFDPTPVGPPAPLPPAPPLARMRWPLAGAAALAIAVVVALALLPARKRHLAAQASGGSAAAGLVGYWRFDEPSGSAWASDRSGHANDCQLVGLDPRRAWRPGVTGGGLALDGSGWLECRHAAALASVRTQMTVAAWVTRGRVLPAYHAIVSRQKENSRQDEFLFGFANGDLVFNSHVWHGRLTAHLPADLGEWFHVAFTRSEDGTTRLFVDGREAARGRTLRGQLDAGPNPLLIGADRNGPETNKGESRFDGAIDDLMIYDRALPSEAIAALAAKRETIATARR